MGRLFDLGVEGVLLMKEEKVTFKGGNLDLEGVLRVPEGPGPFPGVVVCHPHPLFGGSMSNNVVLGVCRALARYSMVALRFNFRGVGRSQGHHSGGTGEQEDVKGAVDYLTGLHQVDGARIGLVGYSFGASVGLAAASSCPAVAAVVGVSPPLAMSDFGFLKGYDKPKMLIAGDLDQAVTSQALADLAGALPQPTMWEVVAGVDHFWLVREDELGEKVASFLSAAFGKG